MTGPGVFQSPTARYNTSTKAASAATSIRTKPTEEDTMAFTLPELPYAKDALAPTISAETIDYHYGKHHQTYVTNLNNLVPNTKYADMSLEDIVKESFGKPTEKPIFNNSAQVWNHTFFWHSLSPTGGGEPTGKIAEAITKSFGSFADFKDKFSKAAIGQFGSGWAWLVKNVDGTVAIETTSNAETPFATGKTCILTIDVWEHAYYIDYRNARPKFVEAYWNLVNWEFANKNLG
jgi:superoxide dismutase, Fe-Mn family